MRSSFIGSSLASGCWRPRRQVIRFGRRFEVALPENPIAVLSDFVEDRISWGSRDFASRLHTCRWRCLEFETRKQLVLEEADLHRYLALFARELLRLARRAPRSSAFFSQYVVSPGADTALDWTMISSGSRIVNGQTAHLQTEFWTRTAAYAQQDPNPVTSRLSAANL